MLAVVACGCSTPPEQPAAPSRQAIPALQGSYHQVRRGETLWRIAHSYGIDVATLARVNQLPNTTELAVGQQLFIPLPKESGRFLWPLRGTTRSSTVPGGVDIAATPGSLVRASRSGRVAVAAKNVPGWGKTVLLDHGDGYLSVYAGLDQVLVPAGVPVRQGMPVGSLGTRPLHFEIRYHTSVRQTLALLPSE